MSAAPSADAHEDAARAPRPVWVEALAGVAARATMSDLTRFPPPADGSGRPGAVLVLFGSRPGPEQHEDGSAGVDVLLTERAASLRAHAGQVAFPGGAVDPADGDPRGAGVVTAALREAQEETGLDPAGVEVLGVLPRLYLPVSDFVVAPVLAWWREPVPVAPVDRHEVARVVRVPLADLLAPSARFRVRHPSGYVGPGFRAGGLYVWGFTAGLLSSVLSLAGWERPWDEDRLEELPRSALRLEDEPLEGDGP